MHPHSYSSKFPPLTPQRAEEFGTPLPENSGNRAGVGGEDVFERRHHDGGESVAGWLTGATGKGWGAPN